MKMSKDERVKNGLKASNLRSQGMIYKAIDNYSLDMEVLGYASTKKELDTFFNQRVDDTDGECYLIGQVWNNETNIYELY